MVAPLNRPNILFLMFDQMSALSLPGYGHPLVQTPHLDALARRGTLFQNAYCASPLCSPSRFAMLTGKLPSRIGAFDNASELPSSLPTFLHVVRTAGYRTCLSGKMDFTGADQLHGYEERLTTDLSPSDLGWTPDWDHPERVQPWYHTLQSVAEAGPCDYSLSLEYDEDATFRAQQWLHRNAGRTDGRPFMLTLSVMHPHDPYQALRRFWDLYPDDAIDMPAVPALPRERRDAVGRRLYDLYDRGEIDIGEAQVRRARRAYYGMLSYSDALAGRMIDTLKALDAYETTIVVVTSDHGDMLGERGLWYKMAFFERAVRVPLIVAGPGIGVGKKVTRLVSHLDLFPTFRDLSGHGAQVTAAGRSLWPDLGESGGGDGGDGEVVAEYLGEGYQEPAIMIRRGQRKFVYSRDDGSLLFDLGADPLEQRNLALEPAFAGETALLVAEAEARWDFGGLRARIVESQRQRRFVHDALTRGRIEPWDFEPRMDAAGSYYRNYGTNTTDPDALLRLPRR